ncbi:hypothetical protein GX865_04295 [Candidatus Saccharibacteria bacterium]|jgi:hypothetical protein|nr:hypothetical protein [Candidatus Saccharibacteria bacterium]
MRYGIFKYKVTSPKTADDLRRTLISALENSEEAKFEAVSTENPEQSAKSEVFRVKVESVHTTKEGLLFDVIDSENQWIRLEIEREKILNFDLYS